ncbi:hypothetical protein [Thermus caldifontis]|uniref:hypothetical protein n=1 Tax=Thermus caldifontis TaxID=1930763 RepID=UPI000DF42832|nr:hypothetical protein [Thermus caldifontis]
MVIIANGKTLKVPEGVLEEVLLRALHGSGSLDEPDGVDLLIHRLLEFLSQEEKKVLVGLAGEDWLELEALVSVDQGELRELSDVLENEEVARTLWQRGAVEVV